MRNPNFKTYLYSEADEHQKIKARRYLFRKIGYPDEGSEFDRKFGIKKYFFRIPGSDPLITAPAELYFRLTRRDALLLEIDGEVVGYRAFQIHPNNSLHLFACELNESYRGNGLSVFMTEIVLQIAKKRGIKKVRIGGGNNERSNRIHASFYGKEDELGIRILKGNWIEIV